MNTSSRGAVALQAYDGAGNVFLLVDARASRPTGDFADLARRTCSDPGFPADGLLVIEASNDPAATAKLTIYNVDGSIPEMCGNGARCAVRHLLERNGETATLATDAGLIAGRVVARGDEWRIALEMGVPAFGAEAVGFSSDDPAANALDQYPVDVDGTTYRLTGVSMGNPHVVMVVEDPAVIDVPRVGRRLEADSRFARGTNVHFMRGLDERTLEVRHWERGAGETAACGTGAVACAVTAIRAGTARSPIDVRVPGGVLTVAWSGGTATLTGPVRRHPDRSAAVIEAA